VDQRRRRRGVDVRLGRRPLLRADETVTTKPDWHEYLAGFVPMLTAAPEHARMTAGEQVALWYFPQTAVTQTTLASELFTVRNGQIVEIRLAFDRLGYIPPDQRSA
jgi:hypothetical protein